MIWRSSHTSSRLDTSHPKLSSSTLQVSTLALLDLLLFPVRFQASALLDYEMADLVCAALSLVWMIRQYDFYVYA
jgi:hypothetical protein